MKRCSEHAPRDARRCAGRDLRHIRLSRGFRRFTALLLPCFVSLACAPPRDSKEPAEPEEVLAFVDVTVVPMDSERVDAGRTVVVRGDRIDAIGPASRIEVPEAAVVIDGRGRYLMPGLMDMHVHLDSEDPAGLAAFVANGVTAVRNMWGSPELLQWRESVEDGELLGPTIYTTGPILDGDPPAWPGSRVITTPEEAVSEVAAEKRAGYDGVKVLDNLSPEVYRAVLSAAREQGLPVYGHVPWRVGLEDALVGGQKSFEHMTDWMHALLPDESPVRRRLLAVLAGEQPMSFQSYLVQPFEHADVGRIPALAARAATAGVWFCPTLVVDRKLTATAEEFQELRSLGTMQYVAPSNWTSWDGMEAVVTSEQGDPAAMREGLDTMLASVRALHQAGVGLLIGTDTPNPFVIPGFSVHEELQNFVDAGLTPYEALRSATRDAGDFLGASKELGTVAVGRRADLVLVEANPLDDVGNVARRVGVSLRGRWFPEEELRALLDELARHYVEAKLQSEAPTSEDAAAGEQPD